MPVVEALQLHADLIDASKNRTFFELFDDAYRENFRSLDGLVRSKGQLELRTMSIKLKNTIMVAPTSYGKSEVLIERAVKTSKTGKVCIVVPSKSLIAQTKFAIYQHQKDKDTLTRIIIHPEAFNGEQSFIAVMTQERLHRLFMDHPDLRFDEILVDEAQNILPDTSRAIQLSAVLFIARNRNKNTRISYFTPFMENPEIVRHIHGIDEHIKPAIVNENMKSELFFYGEPGEELCIYDQFLNQHIPTSKSLALRDETIIKEFAGQSTLVYVNKPRDAELLGQSLAAEIDVEVIPPSLQKARSALAELIHPQYKLIDLLSKGVLYHHGRMPETIRHYVEDVFRNLNNDMKIILVTTSTLLEGVNTPADRLILVSPQRGRKHLTPSAFRNLIGRVGRLSTIFDKDAPNLELLAPRILLYKSRNFSPQKWNVPSFLESHADLNKSAADNAENPLLECSNNKKNRKSALSRIENTEEGASGLDNPRKVQTEIGALCFKRGVTEFDIFKSENIMQIRVDSLKQEDVKARNAENCIDLIYKIFLQNYDQRNGNDEFQKIITEPSVRRFHTMHLQWRIDGIGMREMISNRIAYWKKVDGLVYVSSAWGDRTQSNDEFVKMYIDPREKTDAELVNLAIVRIKEENDFLDYKLMKFIEILSDLNFIEPGLALKIKYGTTNKKIITLLRNGYSFELARLLLSRGYLDKFFEISYETNTVVADREILARLSRDEVNEILIYEMRTLIVWS